MAAAVALAAAAVTGCAGMGDSDSPVTGPTLVAVGDIACAPEDPTSPTRCADNETAELVAGLDPDALALLGDIQYPVGALDDFRRSFGSVWGRLESRMRPAVGNAEYGTPGAAGYFRYFGSRAGVAGRGWYSYDLGGWHLVVLNSNCREVGCRAGSPQERWLRSDLRRNRARCLLAYWHHPRFSSGSHGSDRGLAALWRTFERAGGDVVLSGHDHGYERFAGQTADGRLASAGTVQFVVGTGGRGSYPLPRVAPHSRASREGVFGVLELTLGAGEYAWRFVAAGERADDFDAGARRCS